jgi:hypothetical protein
LIKKYWERFNVIRDSYFELPNLRINWKGNFEMPENIAYDKLDLKCQLDQIRHTIAILEEDAFSVESSIGRKIPNNDDGDSDPNSRIPKEVLDVALLMCPPSEGVKYIKKYVCTPILTYESLLHARGVQQCAIRIIEECCRNASYTEHSVVKKLGIR